MRSKTYKNCPNVKRANDYVNGVLSGKIVSNKWVKLACKRHVDNLQASEKKSYPFYFCEKSAERVCKFVQMFPHVKGKWAAKGELTLLQDWQCFFICSVFGWLRKSNDLRRFRIVELYVPRKNGKSHLAAAIGNYMLSADGEYGAEVYSGATSEKQAWEVFRPAKLMAEKVDEYKEFYGVVVNASNISIPENASKFETIIGNPGDGSSPSCAIIDEYHEHEDDKMFDTMLTGMGAREQPLLFMITTAGDNLSGPCYHRQQESQKILEGVIDNDEVFALIYSMDEGDDWKTELALKKANPNLGVSVDADFLLSRLRDAVNNSRKQAVYQTKHLNVWVGARNAYFNIEKWRQCGDTKLTIDQFRGRRCKVAIDLASKVDIAAVEILFESDSGDDYVRFGRYYLPSAVIENGENEHYRGWANDGWITLTDGEIIDYDVIKEDLLELASMFQIDELGYDPYQATMLITQLMADGMEVVEIRPTIQNFSEPMKMLDGFIRAGRIRHNGDPVMTWMLSNVVTNIDPKDNVYPRKAVPENKIDGAVALIMCINRAIIGKNNEEEPMVWGNML